MLREFYLDFSIPAWIFFILVWVLIFLGLIYYRRTLPPLSKPKTIFLSAIRSLILLMVIFLLIYPVLHTVFERKQKPTVAVLLDDSKSMQIRDKSVMRGDSLNMIINQLNSDLASDSFLIREYTFGAALHSLRRDSLKFDEDYTNISRAMTGVSDSLSDQNLQKIILVSDGQYTEGTNPLNVLNKISVPVTTVALGDTSAHKDLKITDVQVNRIVYANEEVEVKVNLMQEGYKSGKIVIKLNEGSKQIGARTIDLPPSGFEKAVTFKFKPARTGDLRYSVSLDKFKDEISPENNVSSFLLKVLKSRQKALLLSGRPSFDQRMLNVVLRQIPTIDLVTLTETANGSFYEQNSKVQPDSFDVFIFLDYPNRISQGGFLQNLLQSSLKRNTPIFFFLSRNTQLPRLAPLKDILPIQLNSALIEDNNTMAKLSAGGRLHPVTRLDDNPDRLLSLWSDLPPVNGLGRGLKLSNGAQVLVEESIGSASNNPPLLLVSRRRDIKTLLFAATDFNAWYFQLQDNPDKQSFFKMFMENAVRWLVNREDIERIQIKPKSQVFHVGEMVNFSGKVLDEFYEPVKDAEVKITLTGDSSFSLSDQMSYTDGVYNYQTTGLSPGLYNYEISATRNNQPISTSTGKFLVEALALEMQQTAANYNLLQQIAQKTGGNFIRLKDLPGELKHTNLKSRNEFISKETDLWNHLWWLVILTVLLSLEWFFRKRWGLL
jgi:hypothetical protein